MELKDYIKKWSEKLTISEQEIEKEYNTILEEEKQIHPALDEQTHKTRALQRLAMNYKKQLRSPAVGFEGIIIATSNPVDTIAKIRQNAKKLYEENAQMAIGSGMTDEDGNPLDTRETWSNGRPNPAFGNPLPQHNWLRTIYGVARKTSNDEFKFFELNITGENVNKEIPLFKSVSFRAIDRSTTNDKYTLNPSAFTEFNEAGKELEIKKLMNYCKQLNVTISELDTYHEKNKDNYNRLCIVVGDVTSLNLQPTAFGTRIMTLDDSIDIESKGVTCWIPDRIDIDFEEQSKVYAIGRTTRGKKRDELGNYTDEPGDVMLNVYGLYALPEYKIENEILDEDDDELDDDLTSSIDNTDSGIVIDTDDKDDDW